jgi:hypothetical protein
MKTSILVACGLFFYLFTPAQVKPPSLSALPAVTIRLNQDAASENNSNSLFSHFEVIDQRPDTGRIGLHINKGATGHARDRQLVFARPAATEIADWLNQHFTRPDAPYTGLIVLRTLWLSDANYPREDLMKDPQKQQERTHIRLKAEVYAGKDSNYMPLFRFDTLSYTIKSVYSIHSPYSNWERDMADILGDLADSASFLANQRQAKGRQIPLTAIHQFNQSRFVTPIDSNPTLTRGVYASFEEFRNNAPSIQNFEIKMEGSNMLLYIRESSSKSYYSHDAWGYCDGKDIFIMRDGLLRFAWKEGKAFYFSSSVTTRSDGKPMTIPASGAVPLGVFVPGAVITSNMNLSSRSRYIYTIDMDTGSIY